MTLAQLLKQQRTEFWGSTYEFKPALLRKTFGDGGQLLQLFPINERPRYWIVRVDSTCTDSDALFEILDDIYEARGAYLHLESSELIEAIRGKHGDPLSEAADVLLVLMSITESAGIQWSDVMAKANDTVNRLIVAPRYAGEEFSTPAP